MTHDFEMLKYSMWTVKSEYFLILLKRLIRKATNDIFKLLLIITENLVI